MERDFIGLGSKLSPITVKEETNQDSAPSRGMMEWSLSSKVGSAPQYPSFGTFQQDRRINSANDHLLPPSAIDLNRRTYYSSVQEVRMFPLSSQQDQTTITASMSEPGGYSFSSTFINHQLSGGSPIMALPVSVFPAPTYLRSSSESVRSSSPSQLTIFYAGSVSVYQDITPEKAHAIMLLAGNGPQAKPVSMPKPQKPVHHSFATTNPQTMPPSFLPSISYLASETGSESNVVTGLRPTETMVRLPSTHNNQTVQTDASTMAPAVGLQQTRKASLARFLEKRKERVINVSPYYVDKKSSIDCRKNA